MADKKKQGRKTEYTKEILEKTKAYLDNYEDLGDAIPSIAGLSCELGKSRSTIYKWKSDSVDKAFSDILEIILSSQERKCLNKGLNGDFNPAITKLVLGKHGYNDKPEIEDQEESPPLDISFNVKEPVTEIKTTNAKP